MPMMKEIKKYKPPDIYNTVLKQKNMHIGNNTE